MSKRDEFIRKMKDQLDEWNLEIDALEEKNKGWFAVKCRKQEGGTA